MSALWIERWYHDLPDVLSVAQLAQALHIGKNSAYRLIRERRIGCKHIGRKIIIPKSCLIDYLQSAKYTVDLNGRQI